MITVNDIEQAAAIVKEICERTGGVIDGFQVEPTGPPLVTVKFRLPFPAVVKEPNQDR